MGASMDFRERRMTFYKDDMDAITKVVGKLLRESRALSVMIVDKDGHLIAREGEAAGYDPDTVSALVAGSFAATEQVAKMLGEQEFSVLFHQGERDSIQFSLVGQRVILAVVFNDQTTVGMVRLYADQAVKRLAALFEGIVKRKGQVGSPQLDNAFGEAAGGQIDDVFKDRS
ncbi:MAG: roadblock/LC7 domain-containing protein [Planctomycetota bacterium]